MFILMNGRSEPSCSCLEAPKHKTHKDTSTSASALAKPTAKLTNGRNLIILLTFSRGNIIYLWRDIPTTPFGVRMRVSSSALLSFRASLTIPLQLIPKSHFPAVSHLSFCLCVLFFKDVIWTSWRLELMEMGRLSPSSKCSIHSSSNQTHFH